MASINVAHYWRPGPRHQWRESSVSVNVEEPDDKPLPVSWRLDPSGIEYADIPYDWEFWSPPKRARMLPGLLPVLDAARRLGLR